MEVLPAYMCFGNLVYFFKKRINYCVSSQLVLLPYIGQYRFKSMENPVLINFSLP